MTPLDYHYKDIASSKYVWNPNEADFTLYLEALIAAVDGANCVTYALIKDAIDPSYIPIYGAQNALRLAAEDLAAGHEFVSFDRLADSMDEQTRLFVEQARAAEARGELPAAIVDITAALAPELEKARIVHEAKEREDAEKLALTQFGPGDRGNAECVEMLAGGDLIFTPTHGWMRWTGSHWSTVGGEQEAFNLTSDVLQARYDATTAKEYEDIHKECKPTTRRIKDALTQFKHRVTEPIQAFPKTEHILNVANGMVDLRTGELHESDRELNMTYCVMTPYVAGATSDLWEAMLNTWFDGDQEMIGFVQRAIGYSLTGSTREECAFYVYGPARAGKGTLINTVVEILGNPIARGTKFATFTDSAYDPQNFRLAPLWNARLVAASENQRYKRMDESTIKTITGRDNIEAAFKGKDSFAYTPQYKLWLTNNWPIRGDASDTAFWSRFKVIHMPHSFVDKEDKLLKDELMTHANRIGILAWAIRGAVEWYRDGLGEPVKVEAEKERQRQESDPLYEWIQEEIEKTDSMLDEVSLDDLYQRFCEYDAGEKIDRRQFGRLLSGYGFTTKVRKVATDGKRKNKRFVPYCRLVD